MIKNLIYLLAILLILSVISCFLGKNLLIFSESIRPPKSGENAQSMESKAAAYMNNREHDEKRQEVFLPEHDIIIKLTRENMPYLLWIWFWGILFTSFTMAVGKIIIRLIENVIGSKSAAKLPPSG